MGGGGSASAVSLYGEIKIYVKSKVAEIMRFVRYLRARGSFLSFGSFFFSLPFFFSSFFILFFCIFSASISVWVGPLLVLLFFSPFVRSSQANSGDCKYLEYQYRVNRLFSTLQRDIWRLMEFIQYAFGGRETKNCVSYERNVSNPIFNGGLGEGRLGDANLFTSNLTLKKSQFIIYGLV